jgi:flagellar P-ring protein precursor FlgI
MVTANLPATAKAGSAVNVTISSIGSASSLQGGVLLQTPLTGIDGKVYALAQGPILVGGYSAGGAAGGGVKSNATTVATIPGGGTVEREIPFTFNSQRELSINMHVHDFSTTQDTVEALNTNLGGDFANALDASTIKLQIPPSFQGNLVPLMASIENIEISPQTAAKVVVDEKTGTIVIGKDVRLARVAVAHGNLQVTIQESTAVSQPNAFSQGTTVTSPVSDVTAREELRNLNLVEGATLQELVDGLNSVGANPRDLITILRTLKASGSLYADLEVL